MLHRRAARISYRSRLNHGCVKCPEVRGMERDSRGAGRQSHVRLRERFGSDLAPPFGMEMLTRCLNLLKRNGIRYSHSIHPSAYTALDVASAERVPAHEVVKTVVYYGDNGHGMLLLPADYVVDFNEVRKLLGLTFVRLADEAALHELFADCETGAMPPFGNLFGMPVVMDERLADAEFIAFTAGTHRDVIRMGTPDFRRLVNPLVAAFAYKEELATKV